MEKAAEIKSPFTGGHVKEVFTMEQHEFRKETFDVHVRYFVCEDTGERFTTTEQDELMFNELYAQYRVRHGIPFPEEIAEIRRGYGLNYTQISRILGFGANQYAQYENGQMPSESNGKMIAAIRDRNVILSLLDGCKDSMTSDEYEKARTAILAASSAKEKETIDDVLATLSPLSTKEMIEASHQEPAWKNHISQHEYIPYSEAFTLSH